MRSAATASAASAVSARSSQLAPGAASLAQPTPPARRSGLLSAMDVTELRQKADQGNIEAQHGHLGAQCRRVMAYREGMGVPQDDREAARIFHRAANKAEQGDATAQFNLALLHEYGTGVPQDMGEAGRFYRLAAEQGHADAQFAVGQCCEFSRGMPQDIGEAARFYRLAAEHGLALAQLNLGELLLGTAAAGMALPAAPGEAARFLAQATQQTEDEEVRLEARAVLIEHAHDPDVVRACCVGCGQTQKLKSCSKCLTAKFCGAECVRRMWPVHKQSCKAFAAAREEVAAAADEHGAAPADTAYLPGTKARRRHLARAAVPGNGNGAAAAAGERHGSQLPKDVGGGGGGGGTPAPPTPPCEAASPVGDGGEDSHWLPGTPMRLLAGAALGLAGAVRVLAGNVWAKFGSATVGSLLVGEPVAAAGRTRAHKLYKA
ncbi:hypothetical protein T492DRAFT_853578 [Pavlovales sp. CCMP2436]|nr:hypothetical protein T492DRAFT_853578 [Pavlovales sp. CCMP2436]